MLRIFAGIDCVLSPDSGLCVGFSLGFWTRWIFLCSLWVVVLLMSFFVVGVIC